MQIKNLIQQINQIKGDVTRKEWMLMVIFDTGKKVVPYFNFNNC